MAIFNTKSRPLPTVAIDVDGRKIIINKKDYDSKKHSLWYAGDEKRVPTEKKEEKAPKKEGMPKLKSRVKK